jgi:RHS repeat-associated protein
VPAGASPTLNSYLYRGERYDADLGLYYLRARWYNPVTGRFLTRDPYQGSAYDPASLHRYNYARANPVNFIDPSGRSAAAENALVLSLNSVAEAAGVAALGYEVRCALYAEASAVHLVDEHMDQDITQLGLLMNQCAAQITVSQFGGWRTQSFSILNQPTNLGAPSFRVLCSVS